MHDWHEFCGDSGPDVAIGLRRPYSGACPITEIGNDVQAPIYTAADLAELFASAPSALQA